MSSEYFLSSTQDFNDNKSDIVFLDPSDSTIGELYDVLFIDPRDKKIYDRNDNGETFNNSVPQGSTYKVTRKEKLLLDNYKVIVVEFKDLATDESFEVVDNILIFLEDDSFTKKSYLDEYSYLLNDSKEENDSFSFFSESYVWLGVKISDVKFGLKNKELVKLTPNQLDELVDALQITCDHDNISIVTCNKNLKQISFNMFKDVKIHKGNFRDYKERLTNHYKQSIDKLKKYPDNIDAICQEATSELLNTFHQVRVF